MSIEKVKATVVDDIEFYVSSDGSQCGVSVPGLARLCGVNVDSLRRTLTAIEEYMPNGYPKQLEPLQGKVFNSCLVGDSGTNKAKIVTSESAATIIEYYAYESKSKNPTAQYSFRKFARLGIDSWIRQVTGYTQVGASDNKEVVALLQQVLSKVDRLEAKVEEYNGIRKVTATVFPNLDQSLDDMKGTKALPDNKDRLTISEWLATKGLSLDREAIQRFGQVAADSYRAMTGKEPPQVYRKMGSGKSQPAGRGYKPEEFPVLEMTLRKLLNL